MFYRWGIDYLGELPPSKNGNRYAIVAVDYFSKWIEVIPVPTNDAETTVRTVLLHLIARYGVPAEIVCDNGPSFKGVFEAFCQDKLIDLRFITPGMPRSNGLAERAVGTVKRSLQKYVAQSKSVKDWDTEGVANILLGYRCTRQAATGLSPAQILFAQDPAVNADKWVSRGKKLDYEDEEACADELLKRAEIARELRVQVAENLRLAHARNAARFKALRSGIYQPKVHHFQPGDFVFVINNDDIPGGALGIPARDEILRVVEVKPSGVLVLHNQVGKPFERHMEQCAPCNLSNVEGTIHPDMVKPSWNFPCSVCGDHRQGGKMLLCDGCNLGYHTYCLPEPLAEVPEQEIWLCHHCLGAGITEHNIVERRGKYIPVERVQPNVYLPSESRRRRARALAEQWHGAAVKHETKRVTRFGRLSFTDVENEKWFKVQWLDGSESFHDTRILARLEMIPEGEAPHGLAPRPDPVVVLSFKTNHGWPMMTLEDVQDRLESLMPGSLPRAADQCRAIHNCLSRC
jgi:transposase InsO family protein